MDAPFCCGILGSPPPATAGPDELLVAAKIGMPTDRTLTQASADIDVVEARIREAVPAARVIYLEPDVVRSVVVD